MAVYVKSKDLKADLKNKNDENTGRKSNALMASSVLDRNPKCFKCSDSDHLQRDCENGGKISRGP